MAPWTVVHILQTVSDRLATQIATNGELTVGRLVNVARRQRMLSQHLAKAYRLRTWGVDTPALAAELETSRKEFAAAPASSTMQETLASFVYQHYPRVLHSGGGGSSARTVEDSRPAANSEQYQRRCPGMDDSP